MGRIAQVGSSETHCYLTDGLGSTTGLTDDAGDVTGTYEYDAFGPVRSQSGQATEWAYAGEQTDPTGLQYLRARYYDPEVGRFISQDPLPLLERYPYADNNPVVFVDPDGLCKKSWNPVAVVSECVNKVRDAGSAAAGDAREVAHWIHDKAAKALCPEKGYVDYNVTIGIGTVGTFGVQCTRQQGFHFYYGVGVGAGASFSVTYAPDQTITEGTFCGVQVSYGRGKAGVTTQFGFGGVIERPLEGEAPVPFAEGGGTRSTTAGASFSAVCGPIY